MNEFRPLRLAVGALALCSVLIGCGDDDDPQVTACATLLERGATTPNLTRETECTGPDGGSVQTNPYSVQCDGGGRLYANDLGYGVEGEPWQADDRLTAEGDLPAEGPLSRAIDECEEGAAGG